MDENALKRKTQETMAVAMKKFRGESYVTQSAKRIYSDEYDRLSQLQMDQGVVALVLECNLSGGSVGNVDLYKLVRAYLQNPAARNEINAVVECHGF
jgi:hypothetical protein